MDNSPFYTCHVYYMSCILHVCMYMYMYRCILMGVVIACTSQLEETRVNTCTTCNQLDLCCFVLER